MWFELNADGESDGQLKTGAWFVALHLTVWSATVNEPSLLRASHCGSTCHILTHQNFTTPLNRF